MRDGSDSEQLPRALTIRPLCQRIDAVVEFSYVRSGRASKEHESHAWPLRLVVSPHWVTPVKTGGSHESLV